MQHEMHIEDKNVSGFSAEKVANPLLTRKEELKSLGVDAKFEVVYSDSYVEISALSFPGPDACLMSCVIALEE